MRLLIDCDVLLDVLLKRDPHFAASAALLNWAEAHPGSACVAWHTIANIEYLCAGTARDFIRDLLEFAEIPRIGTHEMLQALDLRFGDLEDAMQTVAAIAFGAQIIATRNIKDYSASPIRAIIPAEIPPLLS
jgi:predicted nucleic acid-binding protein